MSVQNLSCKDAYLQVNSINLNYRTWQTEPSSQAYPTNLLLVHGLGSALQIWDRVVPYLIDHVEGQIVALDQRGHGRSDKPDDGYTTDQVVKDDYSFAQALGLQKPVIIGHSWGATIAMAYAAEHPEAVRAIILIDGVFGDLKGRIGSTWEQAKALFNMRDITGMPRAAFLQRYLGAVQGRFFTPIWNEELENLVFSFVSLRGDGTIEPRLSFAHDIKLMRTLWETSHVELARQVKQPVLNIAAEHEPAPHDAEARRWLEFKRENAPKLLKAFPNRAHAKYVVMPDTVHDIPLQRPQELSEIILDFIQEVVSSDHPA